MSVGSRCFRLHVVFAFADPFSGQPQRGERCWLLFAFPPAGGPSGCAVGFLFFLQRLTCSTPSAALRLSAQHRDGRVVELTLSSSSREVARASRKAQKAKGSHSLPNLNLSPLSQLREAGERSGDCEPHHRQEVENPDADPSPHLAILAQLTALWRGTLVTLPQIYT